MTDPTKKWGARLPQKIDPDDVVASWAAWSIYDVFKPQIGNPTYSISVRPILRTAVGSDEDIKALIDWLNAGTIQKFRGMVQTVGLSKNSDLHINIEDGRFGITGTPDKSFGYFYVKAWMLKEKE